MYTVFAGEDVLVQNLHVLETDADQELQVQVVAEIREENQGDKFAEGGGKRTFLFTNRKGVIWKMSHSENISVVIDFTVFIYINKMIIKIFILFIFSYVLFFIICLIIIIL